MNEATWYKWLAISMVLHFAAIVAFSIPIGKSTRRIDLSSSYSVSLVGQMGGGHKGSGAIGAPKEVEAPRPAPPKPAKKEEPAKAKKPQPAKEKQVRERPVRAKPDAKEVSLSKKKIPPKKEPSRTAKRGTPTKEELSDLNRRIREIKKKTDYFDVTKSGSGRAAGGSGSGAPGLPFSGEGGGRPLDLATQRYIMDVWEKVKEAWGLPGPSFKRLETEVTIKIRKDGKIVDINIDKGSGNRRYDDSIVRALRSVDPLPPIPSSVNRDSIEIPFRFRPGEFS